MFKTLMNPLKNAKNGSVNRMKHFCKPKIMISLVLCVLMISSTFGIVSANSKSAQDYSTRKIGAYEAESKHEDNLFRHAHADYGDWHVAFVNPNEGSHSEAQVTDGKVSVDAYATEGDSAAFNPWSVCPAEFSFTFSSPEKVKEIMLYYSEANTNPSKFNMPGWDRVSGYDIYILKSGDENSSLFDSGNKLGHFDFEENTAAGNLVTLKSEISVKAIGFKFPEAKRSSFIFLMELGAYATKTCTASDVDSSFVSENDANNLLKKATMDYGNLMPLFVEEHQGKHGFYQLLDGKAQTDICKTAGDTLAMNRWPDSGPYEIKAEFSSPEYVKDILLYYSEGNKNPQVLGVPDGWNTIDGYELYILPAGSQSELFDAENKIGSFNFKQAATGSLISLNKKTSVKAIGFKFPVNQDETFLYLLELGAYCQSESQYTVSEMTAADVEAAHEENLFRAATANYNTWGVGYVNPDEGSHSEIQVTDGKAHSDIFNKPGDTAAFFNWNNTDPNFSMTFSGPTRVKSILLYYSSHNVASSYDLYILEENGNASELFNESNRVDTFTIESGKAKGQLITLNEAKKVKAVGFRFSKGDDSPIYIMEMGAYDVTSENYKISYITADDVAQNHNKNLFRNATADYNKWGVGCVNPDEGSHNEGQVTDGKAYSDIYNKPGDTAAFYNWNNTDPDYSMTFTDPVQLESILFYYSASNNFSSYDIYILEAESKGNLFDEENRLDSFMIKANTAAGQLITLSEVKKVKAIGFRFPKDATNVYIMELAAYAPLTEKITSAEVTSLNDTNRIGQVSVYNGSNSYLAYTEGGSYNRDISQLIDGKTENVFYKNNIAGDGLLFAANEADKPIRLATALKKVCMINKILISYSQTAPMKNVKIYASDSYDNLFSGEQIFTFENKNKITANEIIKLDSEVKAGYIGFEFSDFTALEDGINGIVLMELGAYGRVAPKYDYSLYPDSVDDVWVANNAKYNLIQFTTPNVTLDNGAEDTAAEDGSVLMADGSIWDGSHYTYWRPDPGHPPLRYTYNMGQTIPIDTILMASLYSENLDISTMEYELYISTDEENLYDESNLVIYHNNEGNYIPGRNDTKPGSIQFFRFEGEKPVGRYIGLRFIDPCVFDDSIRIEQFGVYSSGCLPVDPVYAQRFTDDNSGVEVCVRKLNYNDEFNLVNSIKIEREANTSEILGVANSFYLKNLGDRYIIKLLDSDGNEISAEKFGGRKIELYIPFEWTPYNNQLYACKYENGKLQNLNAFIYGNRIFISFDAIKTFGFYEYTFSSGKVNSQIADWDPIYELSLKNIVTSDIDSDTEDEDYGDDEFIVDNTVNDDSADGTATEKVITKYTKLKKKSPSSAKSDYRPFLLIPLSVILGAGIVTGTLIFIKKGKKRKQL